MPIQFRYLLALLPPAWLVPLIAAHRAAAGPLIGPVSDARLHMTLVKWELRSMRAAELIAAIRDLLATLELTACRIVLSRCRRDGGARLVTGGRQEELRALQRELQRRLAGLDPIGGGFHPHVTLGYGGRHGGNVAIDPIGWMADRLVLIESWHGASHHRHVASWPLVERQRSFDLDEMRRAA